MKYEANRAKVMRNYRIVGFPVLVACAVLAYSVFNNRSGQSGVDNVRVPSSSGLTSIPFLGLSCVPDFHFLKYTQSAWEREWMAAAKEIQTNTSKICDIMWTERERVEAWLNITSASLANASFPERFPNGQAPLDDLIFSQLTYKDDCTGLELSSFIEPLVAHFRNPLALPWCRVNGIRNVVAEDRNYLLFGGLSKEQFNLAYPGKKYLFDLGTARYNSSVAWYLDRVMEYGHEFDEIWAWEVRIQEPKKYWQYVPDDVLPRLHFYNVPVTDEPNKASNPLNIIRRIQRPGDYVVVKLDIDHSLLEMSFIDQIDKDPDLLAKISELSFEMHYDDVNVNRWFHSSGEGKSWIDVLNLFADLRHKGLRIHYWP